jgi:hypothetical protein
MINFKKAFTAAAATGMMFMNLVAPVLAADHETLFGEAEYVSPGNASLRAVKTVSDSAPGFGGIDFDVESGLTFAELETLATDYNVTDDSCGGGSPRFQINVVNETTGDEGNIFAYIGPPPSYTGCPPNVWLNSGDLLETGMLIDTSQLDGGTFYDPYNLALAKYGDYTVTGVQLVTDGGWFFPDGEQTVLFDNTIVDETLYDYEPTPAEAKEMCKNGGWRTMTDSNGNPFRNQGQCVSHFARMQH